MSQTVTAPYAPTKVLVQSKYREVRVCTKREWVHEVIDGRTVSKEIRSFRQFYNWRCWMTLEEAEFIVNDKFNIHTAEVEGQAPYFFPAGIPAPVAHDYGGEELLPPFADDAAGIIDPRIAEAAEHVKQTKQRSLDEFNAKEARKRKGKGTDTSSAE